MAETEYESVNLITIRGGAAVELFEQELDRVLQNILDVNTDPKTKRQITLTFTFLPTEERNTSTVAIEATSKLAPFKGAATQLWVLRRDGKVFGVDQNPAQLQMEYDEKSKPRAIRSDDKGE